MHKALLDWYAGLGYGGRLVLSDVLYTVMIGAASATAAVMTVWRRASHDGLIGTRSRMGQHTAIHHTTSDGTEVTYHWSA